MFGISPWQFIYFTIGLGLFSKFGESPGDLRPLLANELFVNTTLLIAIPWAVFVHFSHSNSLKKVPNGRRCSTYNR